MEGNIDLTKVADECIKAISDRIKNLKTLNIVVAGKTGVGKSTLINSIFKARLADTGIGKPVTDHMRRLEKPGVPLAIYDTRGFELGKDAQTEVKDEVLKTIRSGLATKDVNQMIHCIWYCINTTSNRIEPEEIEWLKDFSRENVSTQVPVIIVLTQSIQKKAADELKKTILTENLDVIQIVPVLAEDYVIDEEYTKKAYGLETLIQVMSDALPEELRDTLQNVQIASLEEKKRRAQAAVAAAVAASFGEGFAPIPFSDCALMIPTQVAMVASITAIFGLEVNKSILTGFVSSVLGSGGLTVAGKAIVSNILKLIPGAGTVLGGAISGASAGVLTSAFGEAYILLLSAIYNGEIKASNINSEETTKLMKNLFKEQLKNKR